MITTVIFDFDGVLTESMDVKTKAFGRLFKEEGEDVVKKVIAYHLKHGGVSRFDKFRYYYSEILNRPLSKKKIQELNEAFSKMVVDEVIKSPYVKGSKEFLEKFHNSLNFYIVSGTPETELKHIVSRRGMDIYFKGVYGAPARKGDLANSILLKNNYPSENIIFIGDSFSDYEGAKEAGIFFIGRVKEPDNNPFNGLKIKTIADLRELEKVLEAFQ